MNAFKHFLRITVVIAVLSIVAWAPAKDAVPQLSEQETIIFKVPWRCPAAPDIGCGSYIKPVLLRLERQPHVSEAWLDRPGTALAVITSEYLSVGTRSQVVRALQQEIGPGATLMEGPGRKRALRSFAARKGWYRGAEVDSLSIEEAVINATRLVRRIETKVTVPKTEGAALKNGFAAALKRQFTQASATAETDAICREELLKVAQAHLDAAGVAAIQNAIALGYRPKPNER
ncbi:MAG: hypothetical protein JSR82_05855 [Verrucomicrobia bacterium]|nr:hypothetical protein [Verrucomicrobiota bacterium]